MKLWPFVKEGESTLDPQIGDLGITPVESFSDMRVVLADEGDVTDLVNPHLERYLHDALPKQGFVDTLVEILPGYEPEYYPALADTLISRAKMLEKLSLGKKLGAILYRITGPSDSHTCEECAAILKREGDSSMYYIDDALVALASPSHAYVEEDQTSDLIPPHHMGCRCSAELVFPDLEQNV